jgi:hypothetical protein
MKSCVFPAGVMPLSVRTDLRNGALLTTERCREEERHRRFRVTAQKSDARAVG